MANVKISELAAAGTAPVTADVFPAVQNSSSTTKKFTYAEISAAIAADVDAAVISTSNYTDTAASTSRITFSDTTGLEVGDPLKLTVNAVTLYCIITAVSANSYIDVSGPTIATGANLVTAIAQLSKSRVVQFDIFFPGLFANGGATTTLVVDELRTLLRWSRPKAYLVYAAARQATADTDSGNQGIFNVQVDGTDAFTSNITLPNATTWIANALATADVSNYTIAFTNEIEVDLVTAAGNLDARDLTITLTLILD